MLDLAGIASAFPDLTDLKPLSTDTGQRVVLSAKRRGADVVLKLLRPGQDPSRTEREIEAVTRVKSQRVPSILEIGKRNIAGTDVFFTIEERINGQTLGALLKNAKARPCVRRLGR